MRDAWTRCVADVIIVRLADDFPEGFEFREDAERFLADLRDRFHTFHLELHPDKTRLVEFGLVRRSGSQTHSWRRDARGLSTSWAGRTRATEPGTGDCIVLRPIHAESHASETARDRLASFGIACTNPSRKWVRALRSVVQGHFQHYAVPRYHRKPAMLSSIRSDQKLSACAKKS